jgi:hypothetical protein
MTLGNSYKSYFTTDSELKAHSSALTNERISVLITLYDEAIITAKISDSLTYTKKAICFLDQIWKSFRPVVRNDLVCRRLLNLETQAEGIYLPDLILKKLYKSILLLQLNPELQTISNIYMVNQQVEDIEEVVRDVLQFFKFTFRVTSRQKPDIHKATEVMQQSIDAYTDEQLRAIAGKRNKIQWQKPEDLQDGNY